MHHIELVRSQPCSQPVIRLRPGSAPSLLDTPATASGHWGNEMENANCGRQDMDGARIPHPEGCDVPPHDPGRNRVPRSPCASPGGHRRLRGRGVVRTPSKLPPDVREGASVHTGDLNALVPLDLIRGTDALINCAGHIADGEAFVGLIDRLVTAVDSLPQAEQPVCWFLAGAWGPTGGAASPQQRYPKRAGRARRAPLDWHL